ncbi:MAG: hypothetical protein WAL56_01485 [Candidatus Sulfotelmatobacter sp.]
MSGCAYPQWFGITRNRLVLLAFVIAIGASAFACPTTVPSGVTNCYYFDYAAGSDSANGTTQTAPWQHTPGMANATGNAAAHTPGPGEGWILKGGVTVDYHAFPMNVPWGGSSGKPDYIGYDSAWYTGSSWARPILNGGGSIGYNTATQSLMTDNAHHASYVTVDNLEFTGIYFGSACSTSGPYTCGAVSQYGYSGTDVSWEIKNVYVHGWSHCSFSGACSDPGNEASFLWVKQDIGSSIHDSAIDGSDSSQDCCNAAAAWNEYNLYISYVDNAVFGEINFFHDSVITNMVPPSNAVHGNCIHLFGSSNITELIYNNYITCLNTGTGDEMFLVEEDFATVYGFNNVLVKDGHGTMFELGQNNGGGGNYTFFNNTAECGTDATPSGNCVTGKNGTPTVVVSNNFFISSGNPINKEFGSSWAITEPSPLLSVACSSGSHSNFGGGLVCAPVGTGNGTGNLNINQNYPFAPLDATAAAAIGSAPGNYALCQTIQNINAAAGQACLSDTTLGVAYDTGSHTVSYPARTPIAHASSGSWENGAYEAGQGPPSPPTGLSAIVN